MIAIALTIVGPWLAAAAPWWLALRSKLPSRQSLYPVVLAVLVIAGLWALHTFVGDDRLEEAARKGQTIRAEAARADHARDNALQDEIEIERGKNAAANAQRDELDRKLKAALADLAAKSKACGSPPDAVNSIFRELRR